MAHIESAAPAGLDGGMLLRTFSRHTAVYVAGNIIPAILSVASYFVFVRLFGLDAYGRYAIAAGIALTASAYGSGWIAQSILRYHVAFAREGRSPDMLGAVRHALVVSLAVAALVAGCFAIASPTLPASLALLCAALVVAAGWYQVQAAFAQARLEPGKLVRAETVRTALIIAAPVLAFLAGLRGTAVLLAATLVAYLFGTLMLRDTATTRGNRAEDIARTLWHFGWPMGLWLGFSQLLTFSDRYLVAHFLGTPVSGAYAAQFDIIRKGFIVALSPITLAVHPIVTRLWSESREDEARSVLRVALRWQVGLSAIGVLLMIPLQHILPQTLLQENAALGAGVVIPLAIGSALWAIALVGHKPLELASRTRLMLGLLVTAVAMTVILDVLFIPRGGIVFAAWATVAGSALYLLLVAIMSRRFHAPRQPA